MPAPTIQLHSLMNMWSSTSTKACLIPCFRIFLEQLTFSTSTPSRGWYCEVANKCADQLLWSRCWTACHIKLCSSSAVMAIFVNYILMAVMQNSCFVSTWNRSSVCVYCYAMFVLVFGKSHLNLQYTINDQSKLWQHLTIILSKLDQILINQKKLLF